MPNSSVYLSTARLHGNYTLDGLLQHFSLSGLFTEATPTYLFEPFNKAIEAIFLGVLASFRNNPIRCLAVSIAIGIDATPSYEIGWPPKTVLETLQLVEFTSI